jgi:hypothetical protein
VLLDRTVHHVYRLRGGRIASMEIREKRGTRHRGRQV